MVVIICGNFQGVSGSMSGYQANSCITYHQSEVKNVQ